jgi:hypothetical protein
MHAEKSKFMGTTGSQSKCHSPIPDIHPGDGRQQRGVDVEISAPVWSPAQVFLWNTTTLNTENTRRTVDVEIRKTLTGK